MDIWVVFTFSVQFSCSVVCDSLQPHGLQHIRPLCPSPIPRVYPDPCPLSLWCHPTISSSVVPFSSWSAWVLSLRHSAQGQPGKKEGVWALGYSWTQDNCVSMDCCAGWALHEHPQLRWALCSHSRQHRLQMDSSLCPADGSQVSGLTNQTLDSYTSLPTDVSKVFWGRGVFF